MGAGIDYGLSGPWSFTAEYNYVNLGKGTNSTFTCSTAHDRSAHLQRYANLSLDNIHNSFTMNMFRVGFHYSFGGRSEPPAATAPAASASATATASAASAAAPTAAADRVAVPGHAAECGGRPVRLPMRHDAGSALCDQFVGVDGRGQGMLDKLIGTLQRLNFVDGEIDGYTDSTGSAKYNQGCRSGALRRSLTT